MGVIPPLTAELWTTEDYTPSGADVTDEILGPLQ